MDNALQESLKAITSLRTEKEIIKSLLRLHKKRIEVIRTDPTSFVVQLAKQEHNAITQNGTVRPPINDTRYEVNDNGGVRYQYEKAQQQKSWMDCCKFGNRNPDKLEVGPWIWKESKSDWNHLTKIPKMPSIYSSLQLNLGPETTSTEQSGESTRGRPTAGRVVALVSPFGAEQSASSPPPAKRTRTLSLETMNSKQGQTVCGQVDCDCDCQQIPNYMSIPDGRGLDEVDSVEHEGQSSTLEEEESADEAVEAANTCLGRMNFGDDESRRRRWFWNNQQHHEQLHEGTKV